MRTPALAACVTALAFASGCALAPEFKTFYLSGVDWRGANLSGRGRLTVADAVAGAAPRTVTILEIGGLLTAPLDPQRRMWLQDARAQTLTWELEREGVAPADIGVEAAVADGSEREPVGPLLAARAIIIVHY
jgi:hypothetical protein